MRKYLNCVIMMFRVCVEVSRKKGFSHQKGLHALSDIHTKKTPRYPRRWIKISIKKKVILSNAAMKCFLINYATHDTDDGLLFDGCI